MLLIALQRHLDVTRNLNAHTDTHTPHVSFNSLSFALKFCKKCFIDRFVTIIIVLVLKMKKKPTIFLVQSSFESVVVVVKVLFDLNLILYAKIESALNP